MSLVLGYSKKSMLLLDLEETFLVDWMNEQTHSASSQFHVQCTITAQWAKCSLLATSELGAVCVILHHVRLVISITLPPVQTMIISLSVRRETFPSCLRIYLTCQRIVKTSLTCYHYTLSPAFEKCTSHDIQSQNISHKHTINVKTVDRILWFILNIACNDRIQSDVLSQYACIIYIDMSVAIRKKGVDDAPRIKIPREGAIGVWGL